jgi:hypothetical protein
MMSARPQKGKNSSILSVGYRQNIDVNGPAKRLEERDLVNIH